MDQEKIMERRIIEIAGEIQYRKNPYFHISTVRCRRSDSLPSVTRRFLVEIRF